MATHFADDISDISSPLTSPPPSSTIEPSSPLTFASRSPSPPPGWRLVTPPPSQDAGEDMIRPKKRRKIERAVRTTRYLDLTEDTAQSDYDRRDAVETMLKALRKRRKIVVVAGAGISVSAGIPDFRSGHGLFRSLQEEHKLKTSGKQLFDASVYKDSTSTSQFHDMVCKFSKMSRTAEPTPFHHLLARLSTEGRLLRLYTQNVDDLESKMPPLATEVPLKHKGPWPQTVQLHGTLSKMTCQKCREIMDFDAELFVGPDTPPCPKCRETDDFRTIDLGRRSHGVGKLRPRMVLYNEQNPDDEAIGAVSAADMRTRPDAVIVVGTSMKIPGVRRIVSEMCKIVRDRREGTTIWINPDPEPSGPQFEDCWDLIVKGSSDDVARLAKMRQWDDPVQDDYSDLPQEFTDSDVDRVRSSQGEIKVNVPASPRKVAALKVGASVLTPPRSNHGNDTEEPKPSPSKLRTLNLKCKDTIVRVDVPPLHSSVPTVQPSGEQKSTTQKSKKASAKSQKPNMKMGASHGKPLQAVLPLVNKENITLGSKPKTSRPKKALQATQSKAQAAGLKSVFKIAKAPAQPIIAPKKEPLSPSRDSQINIHQQQLNATGTTEIFSSVETSPTPQTPPMLVEQSWQESRRITVSPPSKPRGMDNIID